MKLHLNMPDFHQVTPRTLWRLLKTFFTDGWYFSGDPASRDRLRLVACNYTSNIIANLIGGSFWTGLLLLMNADDGFIGTLTMISTAANMLQLFSPLLLERFPQRKRLLTGLRQIIYLINVVFLGLTPLFPVGQQTKLVIVAISVLIMNVISAFISPGLNIWHIQSIPDTVRQGYFSIITMTVGAVVAICNLAASSLVDLFKAHDMEYLGLLVLRGIALVLVVVEFFLYLRIREYPYESSGEKFTIKDLFVKPFQNKLYLKTVLVVFLWNLAANPPGSYYTVYLLKNVEVSYSYLMLINTLNVPVVLFLTPVWKKILQRLDWFKTLYISMLLYGLHYIGLSLTTSGTLFFYPLSCLWSYFTAIGINLSFTGIPYLNMPEKNQTLFIGFYSTIANLAALLGVTFGKYFILYTEGITLNIFGFEMMNKQYLVLLTGIFVMFAALGIWWVDRSVKKSTGAFIRV